MSLDKLDTRLETGIPKKIEELKFTDYSINKFNPNISGKKKTYPLKDSGLKGLKLICIKARGNNETIGALVGGGTTGGNVVLGSGNLTINNIRTRHRTTHGSEYSGVISGSGSVTKTGIGRLKVSGANTYTGGTTVSAGMLMLNINNALTSGRALTLQNSAELFIVQNITQTIGAFIGSSNTTLRVRGGATLNVNQSTDTTMAGTIIGFGSGEDKGKLRKTGSGTLTISGSNNITVENF